MAKRIGRIQLHAFGRVDRNVFRNGNLKCFGGHLKTEIRSADGDRGGVCVLYILSRSQYAVIVNGDDLRVAAFITELNPVQLCALILSGNIQRISLPAHQCGRIVRQHDAGAIAAVFDLDGSRFGKISRFRGERNFPFLFGRKRSRTAVCRKRDHIFLVERESYLLVRIRHRGGDRARLVQVERQAARRKFEGRRVFFPARIVVFGAPCDGKGRHKEQREQA